MHPLDFLAQQLHGFLHPGGIDPQPGQDVGIILIEDLHWLDPASEPWVAEWVAAAAAPSTTGLSPVLAERGRAPATVAARSRAKWWICARKAQRANNAA